jgi:hypothetical protein
VKVVNLYIPLLFPDDSGFSAREILAAQSLLGNPVRFPRLEPLDGIEVLGIPQNRAQSIADQIHKLLPWVSVQLDFGIRANPQMVRHSDTGFFDRNAPATYPATLSAKPISASARIQRIEPATKLIHFIEQAASATSLSSASQTVQVAFDLFASVDFESSPNARFIVLTTALEILAAPLPRPPECVALVEKWCKEANYSGRVSHDSNLKQALKSLADSAKYLKRDSFRGSIRHLVERAAIEAGINDPDGQGKLAATLYDARSNLVHRGSSIQLGKLDQLRQIVRYTLKASVTAP